LCEGTRESSEEDEAGGEAVQEAPSPDGPDLTSAEGSGQRDRPQQLLDERRVVVGVAEERAAPSVAGEEQRSLSGRVTEERPEILVGGGRVAHVELQRLADG